MNAAGCDKIKAKSIEYNIYGNFKEAVAGQRTGFRFFPGKEI